MNGPMNKLGWTMKMNGREVRNGIVKLILFAILAVASVVLVLLFVTNGFGHGLYEKAPKQEVCSAPYLRQVSTGVNEEIVGLDKDGVVWKWKDNCWRQVRPPQ